METDRSLNNLERIQSNIACGNVFLDSYPVQVHFLMIDKCNVKCIMCGGDYFRSKSGRMITLEKFKTMAANLKLENARAIVLAGAGDPLLNRDLAAIIQFVRKTYPLISISVTTNGLALTPKLSGILLENGVALVNISINSASRASYRRIMQVDGFDVVCRNATSFVEQRNRTGRPTVFQFSAAINRLNIEEIPLLVELAREIGVNGINLFYTRFYPEHIRHMNVEDPADRLENSASLFFHQELSDHVILKASSLARHYRINLTHEPLFSENAAPCKCTWPMSQVMVGFDGEIYPCGGSEVHFREKVEQGIYNFGNALQGPVDGFWNSEIYRSLRISSRQGDVCLVPECKCCANTISPNDIRSHIMQWEDNEAGGDASQPGADRVPEIRGAVSDLPLVSVIVPTYNRPEQLLAAVESILAQTYRNLEIIVVNDCGVDVEPKVSALNRRHSITYVKHAENRGLAAARNTGIKVARGKYIAYLDDDDLFYPRHVETLVQALESGEYKVAYTDAYRAHQEKKNGRYVVTKRDVPYSFDFDYDRILTTNFIPVLCFMHERSCVEETGLFDESLKRLEDWDMWIRMSRKFKFTHVKEVSCEFSWRTDGSTMSSGQIQEFVEARKRIAEKYTSLSLSRVFRPDYSVKARPSVVSIVMLTFNQVRYTKECLESIRRNTPEEHEIIFVDNGSSDGTVRWLRELVQQNRHYKLIENKTNLGFAKGCNQGIKIASGEYVLLLNNDTVVTRDWLSGMLATLHSAPDIGIVGPMTDHIAGIQKVPGTENLSTAALDAYATGFREANRHRRVVMQRIIGFCMLFRRSLVEQIGALDEIFQIGNFEDDDFCLRTALAGYRNVIAGDVFIHHYGNRSFSGNRIDADAVFVANRAVFNKKWTIDKRTPLWRKVSNISQAWQASSEYCRGYIDKATELLVRAIKDTPEQQGLSWQLAEMLIEMKLFQDAYKVLNAMPLQARNEKRSIELAGYCLEGLDRLQEARECADQALALDFRSAAALNLMGVLSYRQGNRDDAEAFFCQALTAEPSYGEPHTNLGILKWTENQTEAGLHSLERGFILSPAVPDAAVRYHESVTGTGAYERALPIFREALALYPGHKQISYFLIDILVRLERYPDAMWVIEQAILNCGLHDELLGTALEVRSKLGPMAIPETSGATPSVTLCMAVRNNVDSLALCLAKVRPLVQEMVVVDIGSSDRTREIARVFGARVFDFEWTEDVSAVLNFAVSKAAGKLIFLLDPDEVLSPDDYARFIDLASKRSPKPSAYAFTTTYHAAPAEMSGLEIGQNPAADAKIRLFARHPEIRFDGPGATSVESVLRRLGVEIRYEPLRIENHAAKVKTIIPVLRGSRGSGVAAESEVAAVCRPRASCALEDTVRGAFAADRTDVRHFDTKQLDSFSIVILTFNELEYTKQCVESIRKHTPQHHEIVFVDNGSKDGTVKWLRTIIIENANYKLIENSENKGFAAGCNQGIQAATKDHIILINNDVLVTEGWLSGMMECLHRAPDIGIVGPMTNHISGVQKVPEVGYASIGDLETFARDFRKRNRYRRVASRRVVGFCMLFRRQLIEDIGLLDESFGSGNFEDDDFCLRASLAGYRNLIAGDVFIHHYGSRTFAGNRIDYGSSMSGNRKVFTEKWSGKDVGERFGKKLIIENAISRSDDFFRQGHIEKATASLLEALKQEPGDRCLYFKFAEMLIDAKRYNDALGILESAHQACADARQLALLGYCEEGLGHDENAQEYAERALTIDSSMPLALNVVGVVAYKKGEKDTAEGLFKKATESDPGFGESYTNLGSLKWAAGEHIEALDLFERGFILSPTAGDVVTAYHSAVAETNSFARAEPVFREANALHPNDKRIAFLMIAVLIKQEKHELAMQVIEQAMMQFGIDDGILAAALEVRAKTGPLAIRSGSKRKSLSLCMIVKNEELNLAKCLMSVKPVVEEIIVVDTGSTDKTKAIASALGAKVFDFPWTNDFSEARNYSLSKASGDWILVLDADEVVSPLDHGKLKALIKNTAGKRVAYTMVTRNYTNQAGSRGWSANEGLYAREEIGKGWVPSPKVRLFANKARIRFENPVHELVEPSLKKLGIKIKTCDVPVHHYGRLNQDKVIAKGKEYYRLGVSKIEQTKGDCNALKELAIQASEIGEYREAVNVWQKVIAFQPNDAVAYMNMGFAFLMMKRYDQAMEFSKVAMRIDPELREAALNYSAAEMIAGDVCKAIAVLEDILEKNVDYPPAMGRLAAACIVSGQKDKGCRYLDMLNTKGFDCASMLEEQSGAFFSIGKIGQAIALLQAAVEKGMTNSKTLALLGECQKNMKHSTPVSESNYSPCILPLQAEGPAFKSATV